MKITLTGSLGNISRPLAQQLIQAGHQVTVISSDEKRIAAMEALGAHAAIGSVTDVAFLTKAFTGADVVYTMVPPSVNAVNFREHVSTVGRNYFTAIQKAGVKQVVNLSSIGAHLESGTGPIIGMHDVENILNKLENVSIKHIRAPFFYINFYGNIDLIKHASVLGSNYPGHARLVMVHPEDIATAFAEEIQKGFTGKSVRYIASDVRTNKEIAAVLGTAIGTAGLPWVEFTDEQALDGMLKGGLPEGTAKLFVEMGTAIRSGKIWEDYDAHKIIPAGSIKLEAFAKEFAARYNA